MTGVIAQGGPTLAEQNSDPVGSPDDALSAFKSALETAGKAAVAESAGDARVIAAVKLGWLMQELAQGWSLKPQQPDLVLTAEESRQAQANQLTTQLSALKIADLTTDTPAVKDMIAALQAGPGQQKAQPLDTAVVVAVVGAGARYGSAYVLGKEMRSMIPEASAKPSEPTNAMVSALDMLSSNLPSHAARSVANSMSAWQRSSDSAKAALAGAQVELWRAVIVGEKKGTELLEPKDYLDAAGELERKYVRRALSSGWIQLIAIAALVLFILGIVGLVLASKPGTVLAGISGVLVSIGLTWKGIGGTVGKIVGKLEAPLWGAELDTAITDAITLATVPTDTTDTTDSSTTDSSTLSYADRRGRVDVNAPRQEVPDGEHPVSSGAAGTSGSG
jgi:hypothetical protein